MATVTLQNVRKTYKGEQGTEVTAVHDFNLDIADREFVVFVGPSGCGKSTTLRMIAGLEEISAGKVLIGDRIVNDIPPKDRDIAMVFQNYALYPHMSVYDNLAFGLKLRKFPKAEIKRRVADAAEILGITPYLDRKPKALSGGQRQRVAVGRAIVRHPKVFLFDEPLSNLDAKMRVQMRTEIIKLHQRLQATMIYVTHDQVEAMTMGDRIVVMSEGAIQQIDAPMALYQKPANLFVAGFLGTPPMNFFHGTLTSKGNELTFKERGEGLLECRIENLPGAAEFAGREMVLGIRPEDFNPVETDRSKTQNRVPAIVEIVEPMGAETNIYFNTGSHTAVCRATDIDSRDMTGHRQVFEINPAKIHLFDPETTLRVN
jgi:multiple sugar transport system ATP-binding protein